MIQQENFITSFVRIINITLNVGPCQISVQHSKQTQTTTHRPPVLALLTLGSSHLGVKYFLMELISFGGCLFNIFLFLAPGLFFSGQVFCFEVEVDVKVKINVLMLLFLHLQASFNPLTVSILGARVSLSSPL